LAAGDEDRHVVTKGRGALLRRNWIGALAVAAALAMAGAPAQAFDESKYPDFAGQWKKPRINGTIAVINQWDITKPVGRGQQAPLTPEYQAIFEAGLADQAAGGQGNDPTGICIPDGMPRAMNVIFPMEIVIQPKVVHIMIEYLSMLRRIYTDGRDFPEGFEPSYMGYSIGTWIDEDGDGRYDVLVVETRALRGPRSYDSTGMPFHADNETVINERIYLDKADKNTLYDEITVHDHALTQPWTAVKKYARKAIKQPVWQEAVCAENNPHVVIADEPYMLSADGFLMPAKKDQAPPDLKYFRPSRK
jgi:hypothetical protein